MDDTLLRTIAERFGTPTYVYDVDRVGDQVARLRRAFPQATLVYAVKANPTGALLRFLAGHGVGTEVISLGELERAAHAGVPSDALLIGGPAQDTDVIRRAVELGVGYASLDSPGQWSAWEALGPTSTRFLVRVNPGLDPGTHEHLATGAPTSKFGLPAPDALALARQLADAGRLAGFHVHAGSMVRDPELVDAIGSVLGPLYAALPDCSVLDLGGGFAVPDFPLDAYAERARTLASRLGVRLVLEPGRYLVAEAGVLITRVLRAKHQGPTGHLIADAGMADLARPALYGAEHPIRVLDGTTAPGATQRATVDVDGPLCENADRLGRRRRLAAGSGSLLVVEHVGAYGFAMASNYASSLRPAEVVVEAGRPRLVRRRERPEDLWRLEEDSVS